MAFDFRYARVELVVDDGTRAFDFGAFNVRPADDGDEHELYNIGLELMESQLRLDGKRRV